MVRQQREIEVAMRKITEIIIHCTATKEGVEVHEKDIDRWHRKKGWNGCGYHYVITLTGEREGGRAEAVVGAHTIGHNQTSIGIVYVGGLDSNGKAKDTRTPQQEYALLELCRELIAKYPNARLSGHNQWAHKSCPCFDVPKWAAANGLPYDATINRV